ncbi:MAG: V-type ATP synthase subunit E [Ruminococcus sp.]|nr:V-type ATP synthase subunit E [Ruminococcus sp.]
MNGSDRILSRIKSDCDASVRAIEEQARKDCDRITADAQHEADKQAAAIAAQAAQKHAQTDASAKSRAQLQKRNDLLKRRREEIDKTVEGLQQYFLDLNDCEYFEAVYRLASQLKGKSGEIFLNARDLERKPQNFEKRLSAAGLNATVSQTPADISGGFILKCGDVEENMEFAAIINAKRDEIEDLITRELFAQ